MGSNKQIMTLANSIIGVSVLAMPFCFKECGMLLSVILLVSSSILSRLTCYFLLKSAVLTRRRNYEFLAFHVYGSKGKLTVELFIIGFLVGTCVAFFVVMGDLSPQIVSTMIGAKRSSELRTTIMCAVALFVVLPLGLLRNVDSLEFICTASMGFYLCLVIKVIAESTPYLLASDWVHEIRLWRPEGVLPCLPIFSMALFCQTQLFEVFGNLPNTPLDRMNETVRTSIHLCTLLYASVGIFGYIAFNSDNLTGNVLMSLEPTLSSEVIKLGFVLSVALSFPLVIFPCRASLHSLFYRSAQTHAMSHHDLSGSHIPDNEFKLLTASIVLVSLLIGIVLPNIETVLGLVGSTIGVTVCILLPAMLMNVIARHEGDRLVSKITLTVGIVIMVLGTFSHLASIDKPAPLPEKPLSAEILPLPKSLQIDAAVNVLANPGAAILPKIGVKEIGNNPPLKLPGDLQGKPQSIPKKGEIKSEPKAPQIAEINIKEPDGKASDDKKEKDSVQSLRKMEDLKKVIDKNKEEQEKLLKEQHQILEVLKQHRREAEKLREKSETERKKLALAQNASLELKKLKSPVVQQAPALAQNPQSPVKLTPVETNKLPPPLQPIQTGGSVIKQELPVQPLLPQNQPPGNAGNLVKQELPVQPLLPQNQPPGNAGNLVKQELPVQQLLPENQPPVNAGNLAKQELPVQQLLPQNQPLVEAGNLVKQELPVQQLLPQNQPEAANIIKPELPVQQILPAALSNKPHEVLPPPKAEIEEKKAVDLGVGGLEAKAPLAVLPLKDDNFQVKKAVKPIHSQQEAPRQEESLLKPAKPIQPSDSPPVVKRVEEVHLQPPLPVPPESSSKERKPGIALLKNGGEVDSDSIKVSPEPIPFAYQKKSALPEANQDNVAHRAKRESEVGCEENDSPSKRRSASSLWPDLQPLKVGLQEHVQPQTKDLAL